MTEEEMDKLARKLTKQYDQQSKRPRPSIQVNAFYQGCLKGLAEGRKENEINATIANDFHKKCLILEKENTELKRKCKTPITPQDLMSELGNSIRDYCLKKNIDQSDFAKLLKVKKSTVSWWVTGKVFPSVENLVKIINLIKED